MGCKLIKIGEATAFICGSKPDHECNDNGPIMAILQNGTHIPQDEVEDESEVCGGCVSCSICGEPFSFPRF